MIRIFIFAILTIILTGCGESVSEYKNNEKRDGAIRGVEKDSYSVELRLQALEERVSALERAARHEGEVK